MQPTMADNSDGGKLITEGGVRRDTQVSASGQRDEDNGGHVTRALQQHLLQLGPRQAAGRQHGRLHRVRYDVETDRVRFSNSKTGLSSKSLHWWRRRWKDINYQNHCYTAVCVTVILAINYAVLLTL